MEINIHPDGARRRWESRTAAEEAATGLAPPTRALITLTFFPFNTHSSTSQADSVHVHAILDPLREGCPGPGRWVTHLLALFQVAVDMLATPLLA